MVTHQRLGIHRFSGWYQIALSFLLPARHLPLQAIQVDVVHGRNVKRNNLGEQQATYNGESQAAPGFSSGTL